LRAALLAAILFTAPLFAQTPGAAPQKLTGTIQSFAAPVLTLKTAKGETVAVTLTAKAFVIAEKKTALSEIKVGDFISSTLAKDKKGKLTAEELRVLPESLRGIGEGQYPAAGKGRLLINATVDEINLKAHMLKLSFHGTLAAADGSCSGHASAPGKGLCSGKSEILVPAKAPVVQWLAGDASWLEAGKAVSLYGTAGADGKLATPGVIVAHAATP
jgi:hypothetical protein